MNSVIDTTHERAVFISHSSRNARVALEIRQLLADRGVSSWLAPLDIPPGASYGECIVAGIQECRMLLLLLTHEANASEPVAKELELASRYGKRIVPLRLSALTPAKSLEFFISSAQWVDAIATPVKQRIDDVVNVLRDVEAGRPPRPVPPETPTLLSRAERRLEQALRHRTVTAVAALFLLSGLAGAALWIAQRNDVRIQRQESVVDQDPGAVGHVTLGALPTGGVGPDGKMHLRAVIYVNAKGFAANDLDLRARVEGVGEPNVTLLDLQPLMRPTAGSDAQVLTMALPKGSRKVSVCLTAPHPRLQRLYTAVFHYAIHQDGGSLELTKDRESELMVSPTKACA